MGITMVGYKMIYKNVIYNLISIVFYSDWNEETQTHVMKDIEAIYIDENNRIAQIKDKVDEFQFTSK